MDKIKQFLPIVLALICSAELIASAALLIGCFTRFHRLQAFGAALGLAVMSGAISFHLF